MLQNDFDFVLGSRFHKPEAKRALLPQARWGNRFACGLMKWFFGYSYSDLGPFRAIRYSSLCQLGMKDENFGGHWER